MAKLLDKTGAELIASLVNIADPVGNIANDEALFQAIINATKRYGQKGAKNNNIAFIMSVYADVVPMLFNEAHTKDLLLILSEIEGCSVKEMLGKNGAELVADFVSAWKEQLGPFFERSGITAMMR